MPEVGSFHQHIDAHAVAKTEAQRQQALLGLYHELFGYGNGLFLRLQEQGAFGKATTTLSGIDQALGAISTPVMTVAPGAEFYTFAPLYPTNVLGVEILTAPEDEHGEQHSMLAVSYQSGETVYISYFRGVRRDRHSIPVEVAVFEGEDLSARFREEYPGTTYKSYSIEPLHGGDGEPEPLPSDITPISPAVVHLRRAA